jgi:riboflavin synthase
MFTGIVEEMGTVLAAAPDSLRIGAALVLEDLAIGHSVAINGVCLTVTGLDAASFQVELSPETLRRTNLGLLKEGDLVNLERSVPVGGRLGGHIVQGHVDSTAVVEDVRPEGNSLIVEFRAPRPLMRYVVEKGFVAVDGVSLTVIWASNDRFAVTLIPHTRRSVTLGRVRPGYLANLEVDILAKYVERLLKGESGTET